MPTERSTRSGSHGWCGMRTDRLLWLVFLAAALSSAAELDGFAVDLPADTGRGAVVPLPISAAGEASLTFADGRAETATGRLQPWLGSWQREGEALRWSSDNGVEARVTLGSGTRLLLLTIELRALGRQQWVRTELRVPFAYRDEWSCFDGRGSRPGRRGSLTQSRLLGTFPAIGAFDAGEGLAVGLDPSCWVSTWSMSARSGDGRHGALALSVPLAVDPGHPETLRLAIGRFGPGDFGALPLIEAWHENFPESFRPTDGLDPRVLQGCAAGAVDHRPSERYWPDGFDGRGIAANARVGWEWKYAKFKSGGDLLCRPDDWAKHVLEQGPEFYLGTAGEFRDWRRDNFAYTNDDCGVAPMFYYLNWIDEQLAGEFVDSLITADDVFDGRGTKISPWIHTFSTDLRAFPWANSLGDRLQEDFRALLKELPLAGFAHDVAVGGSRYRPQRYLPGRAYDQRGVWVDEGLGIASTLRFAHSLRTGDDKYRCGTSGNFTGEAHYAIVTETDNPIYEGTVYDALLKPRRAERDRWLLGSKPRCWYIHTYSDDVGLRLDPAAMTAEQLREVMRGRWDEAILWSLRFGWLPSPDLAYGYAPMARALPVIHDCVEAGWHAVPAMTADQPLWFARYGDGLETRLVVMNPHDTNEVEANVRVHCSWLGEGGFLIADAAGRPTLNRFDGDDAVVHLRLPPRSWRLLVCTGRRNEGPDELTLRTSSRYDALGRPSQVGVVESHMGHNPPFFTTKRLAATKNVYEKAGLVQAELPEGGLE